MKRILLIAGHGAGDPGAVAKLNGIEYKEAVLTRIAVDYIRQHLSQFQCEVAQYDPARDAYQDYKNGKLLNGCDFKKYDYVLEVHFNACAIDQGNGKVKGCEVFYPSSCGASGFENLMLDNIAAYGLTKRKAAQYGYSVIQTAGRSCKANLLEICFIDDADDMAIWCKYQNAICKAIAYAIADGLNLERPKEEKTVKDTKAYAPGAWSAEARKWAEENGIITGTGNGMEYDAPVTREQMVVFLHRLWKMMG